MVFFLSAAVCFINVIPQWGHLPAVLNVRVSQSLLQGGQYQAKDCWALHCNETDRIKSISTDLMAGILISKVGRGGVVERDKKVQDRDNLSPAPLLKERGAHVQL
jgi:hypothetical protein